MAVRNRIAMTFCVSIAHPHTNAAPAPYLDSFPSSVFLISRPLAASALELVSHLLPPVLCSNYNYSSRNRWHCSGEGPRPHALHRAAG